jgi:thiol-disulfide isomerase/thioredoxin
MFAKIFIPIFLFIVPINWEPDFENARKTAKQKHELILLNFSGSDWCGPCILLRKEYLESDEFAAMADQNLVLVNADFPRKKKNQGNAEWIKRNDALAEKYNKNGNFPFTLLLDADGKVLKTWTGKPSVTVQEWVKEIKSVCDAHK